jgi:hypothetical protein
VSSGTHACSASPSIPTAPCCTRRRAAALRPLLLPAHRATAEACSLCIGITRLPAAAVVLDAVGTQRPHARSRTVVHRHGRRPPRVASSSSSDGDRSVGPPRRIGGQCGVIELRTRSLRLPLPPPQAQPPRDSKPGSLGGRSSCHRPDLTV